jgi:hypothetical protein
MEYALYQKTQLVIKCPKHGEHTHVISSDIKGHEGHWCQLCFLDLLGQPLEVELRQE